MNDKTKVIGAIERLESELRKSGKNETADFFKKAIGSIKDETDQSKLQEFILRLCSSGAISQYANFTHFEDMLFDRVYEEAKKYCKSK